MIKNTIKIGLFGCIGLLGLSGCNDSFLEKYPETSITEDGFFNNVSDLEAYTNGLYENITSGYTDAPSDNMIYTESQDIYSMMRGEVNPDNQKVWNWEKIRNVNFMLAAIFGFGGIPQFVGNFKMPVRKISHFSLGGIVIQNCKQAGIFNSPCFQKAFASREILRQTP